MRIAMQRKRLFTPPEDRRLTVRYDAGGEFTVKRAWGDAMVSAGDAEEVPAPPRESDEPGSSPSPARRALSPVQVAALDHDRDGRPGGSLPKSERLSAD